MFKYTCTVDTHNVSLEKLREVLIRVENSVEYNAAFCHLFGNNEPSFTRTGFTSWNKGPRTHTSSSGHNKCMQAWADYRTSQNRGKNAFIAFLTCNVIGSVYQQLNESHRAMVRKQRVS